MEFIYLLPLFVFIGIFLNFSKNNTIYYIKKDCPVPHTFSKTDDIVTNQIDFDGLYK